MVRARAAAAWLATVAVVALAMTGCPLKPKNAVCRSSRDCEAQEGFGKICLEGWCLECAADTDCKAGFVCLQDRCRPRPACAADADCGAGETCQAGECLALRPHVTGTIVGAVTDSTGKPVVGALVVATSPELQGEETTITDGAGNYRIGHLPPGRYKLLVQVRGHAGSERSDISLGVSHTLRADLTMPAERLPKERCATCHQDVPDDQTVTLIRYPAIDAPRAMRPGREAVVEVSLEERRTTPTKVTDEKGTPSRRGDVALEVPAKEDEWTVDVGLSMPDAVVDLPHREIRLRRSGPSSKAAFRVTARGTAGEPEQQPLSAVFSRNGRVFARALRLVQVGSAQGLGAPAAPILTQGGDPFGVGAVPDLQIEIISLGRVEKPDGEMDTKDRFQFQTLLKGRRFFVGGEKIALLTGLDAFLKEQYSSLAQRGRRTDDPPPTAADQVAAAAAVRDFGARLWRTFTPPWVKESIRELQRQKREGADIAVYTNDPRLPLELLLVPRNGEGDCGPGDQCELLGVLHRVSRWPVDDKVGGNPEAQIRSGPVAVVAPSYDTPREVVTAQLEDLRRHAGARLTQLEPKFMPVVRSLGATPRPAVLHYAGHGKARPGSLPGFERYVLRLDDRELDLATFRQAAAWMESGRPRGPLLFLNACEVGRAEGMYGWVEGWGPAALQSGAVGFIGGLWALGDAGAKVFADRFYERALAGVEVAEAVRLARSAYEGEADPTLAAYVYYGDSGLRLAERRP